MFILKQFSGNVKGVAQSRTRSRYDPCMDDVGLGTLVRTRRLAMGMTAVRLAEAAGTTSPNISQIESGKTRLPSVEMRRRLAHVLGLTNVDFLVAAGEVTRDEVEQREPAPPPYPAEVMAVAALANALTSEDRRAVDLYLSGGIDRARHDAEQRAADDEAAEVARREAALPARPDAAAVREACRELREVREVLGVLRSDGLARVVRSCGRVLLLPEDGADPVRRNLDA